MANEENIGMIRLGKLHQRLLLIERAIIATRSELEFELVRDGTSQINPRLNLDSGISKMLKDSKKISIANLEPYTKFTDDVYCAYDNPEENKIAISTIVTEHHNINGGTNYSSCIKIAPKISFKHPPTWITIEDSVDLRLARANSQLHAQLMLMFRSIEEEHIPNFSFWFRFFDKDGKFFDMPSRSYPSISSPIMFHYSEAFPDQEVIPLSEIYQIKAMIGLPIALHNDYEVYISHFDLESRG